MSPGLTCLPGQVSRRIVGVALSILLVCSTDAQPSVDSKAPEIACPTWINSEPKSINDLRGKVVLVEFWTFGCYNCRNVEPQIKKWHQDYAQQGLVVIGIHSPEFGYEKNIDALKRYVMEKNIQHAVAVDNDFIVWDRYENRYWPAIYLIDKQGVIRYIRVREGGYRETEEMIQRLLAQAPGPL